MPDAALVTAASWLDIVGRPSLPAFAQAFVPEVILEATVLRAPLRGAGAIHGFFRTTRAMYERIHFVQETLSGRRACLEWEGLFGGRDISGATVLSHDLRGSIDRIRIYHFPYDQLVAFAAELGRRLPQTAGSPNRPNGVFHEDDR